MKTEKIDFLIGYLQEMKKEMENPSPSSYFGSLVSGNRVLEIETKEVLPVTDGDMDGLFLQRENCRDFVTRKELERGYQVIHEGPFDAGKLQYGDWLWDEHYRQWVQFKEIASDGLIGIIGRGINYYVDPYNPNLYFTPPSREERIEKAKEKIKTACFRKQPREGLDEHIHTILTELMEEI